MEVYHVTIFGIEVTLNPVAFTLPIFGGWSVYWYGILIATGFVLAIVYAIFNAKRLGVNLDRLLDVVLVATPVAILCARLYYVIFEPNMSIADFFDFSGGGFAGLAIYGGVIGAFLSGGLMCYLRKVDIFATFDLAAIGFLIGQGIGRWGNFVNQEAFGTATGSDWFGMTSERVAYEMGEGVLVHPCFLYESVWCLIGVLVLHLFSKKRAFKGEVALAYCIWYGAARAIIEGLRTDSLMLGPVRVSQLLSVIIVIAAATIIVIKRRKLTKQKDEEYVPMFEAEASEE